MPTTSVNVGFRPPRILTLIRPDSLEDVVDAARANTHIWGGVHNPVLEVRNVDEAVSAADAHLADLVTTLHPPTADQQSVIDRLGHLRGPRRVHRRPFEPWDEGSYPYLDVRAICRHHFETTFRFETVKSRAVLPTWDKDDPLTAFYSVSLGAYRDDPGRPTFERHFLEGLRAEEVAAAQVPTDGSVVTPIWLTGDELDAYPGQRASGVVVGAPDDPAMLLAYWNLRAVGCFVTFWPEEDDGMLADKAEEELRRRLEPPQDPQRPSLTAWLADPESSVPSRLAALLTDLGTPLVRTSVDPAHMSRTRSTQPCVWLARSNSVLANIDSDGTSPRLFVPLPERPFRAAPLRGLGVPNWLVTVDTHRAHDLGDYTIDPPWIAGLNPWASEAMVSYGDVRTGERGLSIFAQCDSTSVELVPVHKREVFKGVLRLAGLDAKVSPAGEATDRIIKRLGGLWGCRHLRLQGVRKVVSAHSPWTFRDALRAIHDDGTFDRYANVKSAADELRTLIDKDVLRPVLWLRCPHCSVSSGLLPADLADEISCPRCGDSFRLGPALPLADWRYRPSGFFADLKRHGSLPVVLTMIRLLETLDLSGLLIDGSLEVSGHDFEEEIDCVAIWRERNGRAAMAIAECKGGRQELTDEDLSGLVRVADAIRGLGIECYVIAATTRESLTSTEKLMLTRWRTTFQDQHSLDPNAPGPRLGPLVLTADQLDYHYPFPHAALDGVLPEQYILGIRELAINLDAVHFRGGLSPQQLRTNDERLI